MGTVAAIIGGSVIAGGSSIISGRSAARSQRQSQDILQTAQNRGFMLDQEKMDLAKALIAEGKPWREAAQAAGLSTLPLTLADINAEPGTSPMFRTGMSRGTKSIMENLAPYGLSDSSVAGTAIGNLSEGLLSSDTAAIRALRMQMLGLPTNTAGLGVGLLNNTGQDPFAGARAQVAGQDPYASLYSDVSRTGSTIASLGLLKELNFGGNDNFNQFRYNQNMANMRGSVNIPGE